MSQIRNLNELAQAAGRTRSRLPRVAVVCPADDSTRTAVTMALEAGMADITLYCTPGCEPLDSKGRDELLRTLTFDDPDSAARQAVTDAREGRVDVVMKGLINTDNLMRAILNKEWGILSPGAVLSHITVAELPGRDKLLLFTDAAVIPSPTLDQRRAQVRYLADACRRLGIERPAIALVHCTEKTSPKFPVTLDYAALRDDAAAGAFGDVDLDGPMDAKTACDAHSAEVKGIHSSVCGRADALLMPEIESGNIFYKALTCFAHAITAGLVVGSKVPVVVPSRSDSAQSKFYSLALACMMA